jgi:glycosyltransferase involved in cell wall biosynthesis
LRVLQVASYYPPTIGGMETVVRDLAEGLVAAGDSVTVLCAAGNERSGVEETGGVSVQRSPSIGKLLSQPLTPFLPVTLHRLHRRFDIVHLHMSNPLAEAAVLSLPPASATRVVITYHSDIVRQKRLRAFYGPVQRAVLARSRRIVVPTQNHVRYSDLLPGFADKCTVVPFGISEQRYALTPESRELAAALRRRHGRFILFVGRLVYYKGVSDLVEAMRKVDAPLVIVGDGPLRTALDEQVRSSGLGGRVFLAGALPQSELNAHFEACDVLALPSVSRAEGFGMTLLEGMVFGKPLVTTRLPSGIQVVNVDGETGLQVKPRDTVELASALNRLLADDVLRATMGVAARRRVDEVFSLEGMIRGYRKVYEQALRE